MGQPTIPPVPATTSLAGKTVIVTGANTGLGLEAARQYIVLKASRVILAVRNLSKGNEAASFLSSHPTVRAANPNVDIKVMQLDLDDYASVLQFSQQVKKQFDELDVLLLNGGVNIMSYQVSKSGHERVMQVNYYSNALLTLELLGLLKSTASKRGAPSRVTIVGSAAQNMNSFGKKPISEHINVVQHFDGKSTYAGMQRYSDSKLLVTTFVAQLAQRLPADEVIVNTVCPGLVATGFDAHLPVWLKPIMFVFRKLQARTVEEGSRALILGSIVRGPESHGKFISNNEITAPAPILSTPSGATLKEKLWTETLEDVSKVDPSLQSLV